MVAIVFAFGRGACFACERAAEFWRFAPVVIRTWLNGERRYVVEDLSRQIEESARADPIVVSDETGKTSR